MLDSLYLEVCTSYYSFRVHCVHGMCALLEHLAEYSFLNALMLPVCTPNIGCPSHHDMGTL